MPGQDTTLLSAIYTFAWANHIGVGGPDLLPWQPNQATNSYPLIRKSYGKVVTGVAVQDGTGQYINPKTNKVVTAAEIYRFSQNDLQLTYIFWGTEEPFFSKETLPFLKAIQARAQ